MSASVVFASARPALPPGVASAVPSARDTILLVEDDEMVAMLVKRVLERLDWHVVLAGDGAECGRLVAQHGPAIALAMVDCTLPDIEGGDLCERIRRSLPALPVLLTSGRERSDLSAGLAADGPAAFLAKPFLPGDVIHHVQSLMARAA
jgi:CheY-like chemotaxis protein